MGKFYIPVTTGMICRITFSVITVVSGCFRSSIVISVSCIFGSSFISISSSNFFSRSIQITSPVRMNAKVKAYDWNFELYLIYVFHPKVKFRLFYYLESLWWRLERLKFFSLLRSLSLFRPLYLLWSRILQMENAMGWIRNYEFINQSLIHFVYFGYLWYSITCLQIRLNHYFDRLMRKKRKSLEIDFDDALNLFWYHQVWRIFYCFDAFYFCSSHSYNLDFYHISYFYDFCF